MLHFQLVFTPFIVILVENYYPPASRLHVQWSQTMNKLWRRLLFCKRPITIEWRYVTDEIDKRKSELLDVCSNRHLAVESTSCIWSAILIQKLFVSLFRTDHRHNKPCKILSNAEIVVLLSSQFYAIEGAPKKRKIPNSGFEPIVGSIIEGG